MTFELLGLIINYEAARKSLKKGWRISGFFELLKNVEKFVRGLWYCWSPSFAFRYWAQLAHGAFYDAILAHYLRKHYILCTVIIHIHKKENSCIYCNIFSRISSEWTVVLTQNRDRIVLRPSVALSLAWPHLWSTVMHLHSHEQGYRYVIDIVK